MAFKQHPQGQPYSPNLSSQEGVRNAQPSKKYSSAYIQFDLNSTLLHFQPAKVSLGLPLQGLSLNIVLFLD